MKSPIVVAISWVVLGALLLTSLFNLELRVNFFAWRPKWSFEVALCLAGALSVIVGMHLVAKFTVHKSPLIIALIACAALAFVSVLASAPEINRRLWSGSPAPASPDWYRWGRVAVCAIPLLLWCGAARRSVRR